MNKHNVVYAIFADTSRYPNESKVELFMITDSINTMQEQKQLLESYNYHVKVIERSLNEKGTDYIGGSLPKPRKNKEVNWLWDVDADY